jgi:hypothetical protein
VLQIYRSQVCRSAGCIPHPLTQLSVMSIVSRERMKHFLTIAGIRAACFLLLFLFCFVADFYVIVGSGPGSWKKSTPLSLEERFALSFIGAMAVTAAIAAIVAVIYYGARVLRKLRRRV